MCVCACCGGDEGGVGWWVRLEEGLNFLSRMLRACQQALHGGAGPKAGSSLSLDEGSFFLSCGPFITNSVTNTPHRIIIHN